jgi:YfiH family protein
VDEVRYPNGIVTWAFDLGPGARAEVTTRAGGTSEGVYASCNLGAHVGDDPGRVLTNRDDVAEALGLDRLTIADQQHGNAIAAVDRSLAGAGHDPFGPSDERLAAVDGLVTAEPGIGLTVLVADCCPVVLHDPGHGALGVVHAGRRGTMLGVVERAVRALADLVGSGPADLVAGLGPCIGGHAYELGDGALDEVHACWGGRYLTGTRPHHASFDLRRAVLDQLLEAGVRPEAVQVAEATTDSSPALFSDRAARPCGRFALVAAHRGDPGGDR